jgi:diguanylate cyclase (GGDEF)-like protein
MAHWEFVAIGETLLLGYLIILSSPARGTLPGWMVGLTVLAVVATGALWYRGYRLRRYGGLDSTVDAVTVFLVTATVDSVVAGTDLLVSRALLRSMSGSFWGKLAHSAAGFALLAAGLLVWDRPVGHRVGRLLLAGLALAVITLLFHLFSTRLVSEDGALVHKRLLVRTYHKLAASLDEQQISRIAVNAASELVRGDLPGTAVRTAVALGPVDRLQVKAATGALDPAVGAHLEFDGDHLRPAKRPAERNGPQARFGASFLDEVSSSALPLPITAQDKTYGILLVDAGAPVGSGLRRALDLLCSSTGLALATATLTDALTRQALYDPLTRLPNRMLLSDRLRAALARATRDGTGVALLVLDLDGFKAINDEFGHRVGDEALVIISARLLDEVRETDTAARIGGDEFAVLLTDLDDPSRATMVARRIIQAIGRPLELGAHRRVVGVSIGIARWPPPPGPRGAVGGQPLLPTLDGLLHDADTAMYLAKSTGTGYELFTGAYPGGPRGAGDPRRPDRPPRGGRVSG